MDILGKTLYTSCSAANPSDALLMCMQCFHRGKEKEADFLGEVGVRAVAGTRRLDFQFCDLTTKLMFSLFGRKAMITLHSTGRMGL